MAASLNKGSDATLISKSGDWWKVEYAKGKYGYCHAGFITVTEGTPVSVAVSSGTLNVRSGAGTAYGRVGALSKGETVSPSVHCERMEPRPLRRNENRIRQRADLLSGNYASVSLNVPNFKQTDARWADVRIGTSGKTFSQDRLRHRRRWQ